MKRRYNSCNICMVKYKRNTVVLWPIPFDYRTDEFQRSCPSCASRMHNAAKRCGGYIKTVREWLRRERDKFQ